MGLRAARRTSSARQTAVAGAARRRCSGTKTQAAGDTAWGASACRGQRRWRQDGVASSSSSSSGTREALRGRPRRGRARGLVRERGRRGRRWPQSSRVGVPVPVPAVRAGNRAARCVGKAGPAIDPRKPARAPGAGSRGGRCPLRESAAPLLLVLLVLLLVLRRACVCECGAVLLAGRARRSTQGARAIAATRRLHTHLNPRGAMTPAARLAPWLPRVHWAVRAPRARNPVSAPVVHAACRSRTPPQPFVTSDTTENGPSPPCAIHPSFSCAAARLRTQTTPAG